MSGEGDGFAENSDSAKSMEQVVGGGGRGGGGGGDGGRGVRLGSSDGAGVEELELPLPPHRSLSPRSAVDGVERSVGRAHRVASLELKENERGLVRSRSSSRLIAAEGSSPPIQERVLSRSPNEMVLRRGYDHPVEVYRDGGSSTGAERVYYYEDEVDVGVMRDKGDRVIRREAPVYIVERRSAGSEKGPMDATVLRRKYDSIRDEDYMEEENLRLKRVYYEDQIPSDRDLRNRVYPRVSPAVRVERGYQTVERVSDKRGGQPVEPRKKYAYHKDTAYEPYDDDDNNAGVGRGYYYVDQIPISEQEYREKKIQAVSDRRIPVENLRAMEDGSVRRVVGLHPDSGLASDHGNTRRVYTTLDKQRLMEDIDRYEDDIHAGKLVIDDGYYHDAEKYAQRSRDVLYPSPSRYLFKDFDDKYVLRGNSSTSSGNPQRSRDVRPTIHDGNIRSHGEPLASSIRIEYPRRSHLVPVEECEAGHADVKCHQCAIHSTTRPQHDDYPHRNLRVSGENVSSYRTYDEFYEKMPSNVRADQSHRDLPRAAVANPMSQSTIGVEGSSRILRNVDLQEVDLTQKQKPIEHIDMRRRSDALKPAGDYVEHPGYKIEKPGEVVVGEELEMPGYKQAYRRSANAGFQVERVRISNELVDGSEMERVVTRPEALKGNEHVIHSNYAKRKYSMDEDIGGMDARGPVPRKWNKLNNAKSIGDYVEERASGISNNFHSKEQGGFQRNHKLEAEQMFDEINHHKSFVKDDWSRHQGKPKSMQRNSGNAPQSGRPYMKGYRKPESSNAVGQVHYSNRRVGHYVPHKVWGRIGGENETEVVAPVANASVDKENPFKFDPIEETEDFKQMVHAEFLNFCKKLNENTAARKLYKEQGKEGSLFCIVCGRKSSKEFLNTQRLVTHAYMARNTYLRAQHLGLHKAISVLMGWNSVVAPDIITWVPHVLSDEESLAQKEDLILWPPVVIVHNISLSHNDHKEWDVISTDAIGGFLRSKGFNQGKMTICLGNPGDHSVILVKFLGTFSGLREAERFHKYFSERKHGRTDFEQAISAINQNNSTIQGSTLEGKVESLLFGYMGISEDLDRMDFNTKKRCSVKSKKEIQDLADAPVKPGEAM